jgi:molybdopterin/thiamine biosynthesis adenylyltransferase
MILPESQIRRFFRHIIMPEISGQGQKKLLESWVEVCATSIKEAMPLLYYLTAVGIGKISCNFINGFGFEKLVNKLKDINPDVLIVASSHQDSGLRGNKSLFNTPDDYGVKIIIGDRDFISDRFRHQEKDSVQIPVITAMISPWQGLLHASRRHESSDFDLLNLDDSILAPQKNLTSEGMILSYCFMGALVSVEVVKNCLNLGKPTDKPLLFDLMSMTFSREGNSDFHVYEDSKHIKPLAKELSDAKVLIVGAGGLGSPVAFALTSIGVGTVGLIDGDRVELTNLNRQILHSTSRIGMPKVESARHFLEELNPSVNIVTYYTNLTKENAMDLIKDYDVIVAGLDNLPSRYLLNDACFFVDKPLVEAGVLRFNGMGRTILPKDGPCYRCIFPDMPSSGNVPSCLESGILGAVPGVMGFIQAVETVKLLGGVGKLLKNQLLLFEALDMEFRVPSFRKDPRCPLCGKKPTITALLEYENICGEG